MMNHTSPCSTVKCGKGSLQGACADLSVLFTEQDCPSKFDLFDHEDRCMFYSMSDSSDQFYVYSLQRKLQHDYRQKCDVE